MYDFEKTPDKFYMTPTMLCFRSKAIKTNLFTNMIEKQTFF